MGRDKSILPFGAVTLLDRVVSAARSVTDDVVIVGRGHGRALDLARVVADSGDSLGPLAALVRGLEAVQGDRALLLACDLPLVAPSLLRRMLDVTGDADACVPVVDGQSMTVCAVYAKQALPRLRARWAAGTRSLRVALADLNVRWVAGEDLRPFDPDLRSFVDCNTQARYEEALRLAGLF